MTSEKLDPGAPLQLREVWSLLSWSPVDPQAGWPLPGRWQPDAHRPGARPHHSALDALTRPEGRTNNVASSVATPRSKAQAQQPSQRMALERHVSGRKSTHGAAAGARHRNWLRMDRRRENTAAGADRLGESTDPLWGPSVGQDF